MTIRTVLEELVSGGSLKGMGFHRDDNATYKQMVNSALASIASEISKMKKKHRAGADLCKENSYNQAIDEVVNKIRGDK